MSEVKQPVGKVQEYEPVPVAIKRPIYTGFLLGVGMMMASFAITLGATIFSTGFTLFVGYLLGK